MSSVPVWGLGGRIQHVGFGVSVGFRLSGLGCRAQGLGFGLSGVGQVSGNRLGCLLSRRSEEGSRTLNPKP